MGRPYSERFIGETVNTTRLPVYYTVPAGRRAIVRSITATTATAVDQVITVQGHSGGRYFYLLQVVAKTFSMVNFEMRHVLYAGEELIAYTSVGSAGITVSGYLFTD